MKEIYGPSFHNVGGTSTSIRHQNLKATLALTVPSAVNHCMKELPVAEEKHVPAERIALQLDFAMPAEHPACSLLVGTSGVKWSSTYSTGSGVSRQPATARNTE